MTTLDPAGARIERLRARLLLDPKAAFWGALGLFLKLERAPDCETMATDGARLLYAPAFVDSLPDAELLGVIVHEIAHCSLLHHTRRGARDPERWNIAADYAVNGWILAAGYKLPADALYSANYAGMGAEEIYARRDAERRKRQQQQQQGGSQQQQNGDGGSQQQNGAGNQSGAGSQQQQNAPGGGSQNGAGTPSNASGSNPGGAPGNGAPAPGAASGGAPSGSHGNASAGNAPGGSQQGAGAPDERAPGWGRVLDAAEPSDGAAAAASAAIWQERVRAAAAVASKAMGAGNMPAELRRIIAELDAPRHNWRARLRDYADNGARRENSWARPSRRYAAAGLYLPAAVAVNPCHIVAAVDSSGSMDAGAVAESFAELAAVLETGAADRVTVLCVNTRVVQAREFTAANAAELAEFMPEPSGGTRFAPAFDWIAEHASDAAAVVYVTDLDCRDYGRPPHCPVLWLATPTRRPMPAPPFGEVMMLDPAAR